MILETKAGYIEALPLDQLEGENLQQVYDVERDTWAHFLGEYVECVGDKCRHIMSKDEIYSHKQDEYKQRSVAELEKEHGKQIECTQCSGETSPVRGEDYKQEILDVLNNRVDGYMAVYRNQVGEICGMSYGYVDTFENIARREFQYKFSDELLEKFRDFFGELFITVPSTCILQKYQDLGVVYDLLRFFFSQVVDDKYKSINGVFDGILGSPTYNIYTRLGGQPLNLPEIGQQYYKKGFDASKPVNDVFVHPEIVDCYSRVYGMNVREFLKHTRKNKTTFFEGIDI